MMVVPLPENGSSIVSPGALLFRIGRRMHSTGFCVPCTVSGSSVSLPAAVAVLTAMAAEPNSEEVAAALGRELRPVESGLEELLTPIRGDEKYLPGSA